MHYELQLVESQALTHGILCTLRPTVPSVTLDILLEHLRLIQPQLSDLLIAI